MGFQRILRYVRALFTGRIDPYGTPLQAAASAGDAETVQRLLNAGIDVNAGEPPPLHLAITGGNVETVRLLLERGARTDQPGLHGVVALAARMGHHEVVEQMAQAGVNFESQPS